MSPDFHRSFGPQHGLRILSLLQCTTRCSGWDTEDRVWVGRAKTGTKVLVFCFLLIKERDQRSPKNYGFLE